MLSMHIAQTPKYRNTFVPFSSQKTLHTALMYAYSMLSYIFLNQRIIYRIRSIIFPMYKSLITKSKRVEILATPLISHMYCIKCLLHF